MIEDKREKRLVKKYKNICLLLPTYKIINTLTYQNMMILVSEMYKRGFKPTMLMADQTDVSSARNYLASKAATVHIERDNLFDLFLWIDSDHTMTIHDVMNLIYHFDSYDQIDILSAQYITRDNNSPRICAYNFNGGVDQYESIMPNSTGIKEVDGVGFGFLLVSPEVMVDMYKKHKNKQFIFTFTEEGTLSEDFYWCGLAKKSGYKIYVDNEVKVGHVGAIIDSKFLYAAYGLNEQ